MTTTRACSAIAATILAAITVIVAPGAPAAFADPPARPAADKKADKPAAPAPDKPERTEKTAKSEKKEMVSDAEAKRISDFFDKLVAIVVASREDCVKMAAGINGHIDANQALVKDMNDPKNDNKQLPPAVKQRIDKQVRDELTPAIAKKCGSDPGVEAAFNRMGAGRAR